MYVLCVHACISAGAIFGSETVKCTYVGSRCNYYGFSGKRVKGTFRGQGAINMLRGLRTRSVGSCASCDGVLPSCATSAAMNVLWRAKISAQPSRCLYDVATGVRAAVVPTESRKRKRPPHVLSCPVPSSHNSRQLHQHSRQLNNPTHSVPLPLSRPPLPILPGTPLTLTCSLLHPRFHLLQTHLISSSSSTTQDELNKSTSGYFIAVTIAVLGLSYASVPLYRLYCQASGYGGTVSQVEAGEKVESMVPVREREITIR